MRINIKYRTLLRSESMTDARFVLKIRIKKVST